MVRKYKKKGLLKGWTMDNMQAAVDAVVSRVMGYHKASVIYSVPQTTLERYVRKQKANPASRLVRSTDENYRYKPRCVFSKEQEAMLVNYLVYMKERFFALTSREVRSLAFQLASRSGQEHPFNKEEELAGVDWFFGFHRRHPELSLRQAEAALSSSASSGLSKAEVSKAEVDNFYDILEEFQSQGYTGDRIYNADEIGISVHPNTRSRIKKCRRLAPQDRGNIVTAEICFSASGTFIPPMLVFPSDELHDDFENGLPIGSWTEVHPLGFISKEFYMEWFRKFVIFSNASKENPVLLLVDGQSPHIKNLDLLDYAEEHGVTLLCFPAHTLLRLQPIDVLFMKSISHFYEEEVRLWLQTHPKQMITSLQVSPLFGSAYRRSRSAPTANDAFIKTGVWPVVRHAVFQEKDFCSDTVVDCENSAEEDSHKINTLSPLAHTSQDKNERTYSRGRGPAGSKSVLPFREPSALIPILKSHSYRPGIRALKKANDECTIAKNDCEEKKVSAALGVASSISNSSSPSGDSQESYDPQCLYCNDFYSKATEGWWISCKNCLRWAHHSCVGFDDENDEISSHICKECA